MIVLDNICNNQTNIISNKKFCYTGSVKKISSPPPPSSPDYVDSGLQTLTFGTNTEQSYHGMRQADEFFFLVHHILLLNIASFRLLLLLLYDAINFSDNSSSSSSSLRSFAIMNHQLSVSLGFKVHSSKLSPVLPSSTSRSFSFHPSFSTSFMSFDIDKILRFIDIYFFQKSTLYLWVI